MNLGELRENIAQTWKDLPDDTEILLDSEGEGFLKVENIEDNIATAVTYTSPHSKKENKFEIVGGLRDWQIKSAYYSANGTRKILLIRLEDGHVDEISFTKIET